MEQVNFQTDKYIFVKNVISKELCDLATNYTVFKKHHTQTNSTTSRLKFEQYGDYLTESLLLTLLPVVEEHTGLSLYPTFSTYRIYGPGDSVPKHTQRPACEISVTVNLGYNYETDEENYSWPIWAGETELNINPGDMLIYRGLELPIKRDTFAIDFGWQSEASLHYVDADGNFASSINDGRQDLGYPEWTQDRQILDAAKDQWERSHAVIE